MQDSTTNQPDHIQEDQIVHQYILDLQNTLCRYTGNQYTEAMVYQMITRYLIQQNKNNKVKLFKNIYDIFTGFYGDFIDTEQSYDVVEDQNNIRKYSEEGFDSSKAQNNIVIETDIYNQRTESKKSQQYQLDALNRVMAIYQNKSNILCIINHIKCLSKRFISPNKQDVNSFDIEHINQYYQQLNLSSKLSYKEKAVIQAYEKYIKGNYKAWFKRSCYQLLQHLTRISNKQFDIEFSVQNDEQLRLYVQFMHQHKVSNINEFKMRVQLMKYMEESYLDINLNNTFDIKNLSDKYIIPLFENIENRLQWIKGGQFIIIHNVATDYILKISNIDDIKSQIDKILVQFNDGQLYDVVIKSVYKFQNVGKLKLRYLNYICDNGAIELNLSHPEYLITATLFKIKLQNLNECVNLTNLYSQHNIYGYEITKLNLQRFYSQNDQYTCPNSLIQDLFKSVKLKYVSVEGGKNIDQPILLTQNVDHLHFIDIQDAKVGGQFFCQTFQQLYSKFEQKYIYKSQEEYNFTKKEWIKNQLGKIKYNQYRNSNLFQASVDKLDFMWQFQNILFNYVEIQVKDKQLEELASNILQHRKESYQKFNNIKNVIDKCPWKYICNYLRYCKYNIQNRYKMKFIQQMYDIYVANSNFHDNFNIFTILKQIVQLNNEQVIQQFGIQSPENINQLVQHLGVNKLNRQQLKYIFIIYKHLEYSHININININFQLYDIQNDIIIHLFDNLEDRLSRFDSDETSDSNYLISHDVNTNKIEKLQRYYSATNGIKRFIQKLAKRNSVFDLIIRSLKHYNNISLCKIRYLNYIKSGDSAQLALKYPEALISLTICNVKVVNLASCTNLVNLFSENICYEINDIYGLKNIRRFCSKRDRYINENSSMLETLFSSTKLEYVFVYTKFKGNIVKQAIFNHNIINLRYLYVFDEESRIFLEINVQYESPSHLRVFQVNPGNRTRLSGPQNIVKQIEDRLVR